MEFSRASVGFVDVFAARHLPVVGAELIWLHVISDAIIAASYFSIPFALAILVSKRRDFQFGWMAWPFAAFILACGLTHVFSIYTLWVPIYGLEGLVKALTAIASIFTAVLLWPLIRASSRSRPRRSCARRMSRSPRKGGSASARSSCWSGSARPRPMRARSARRRRWKRSASSPAASRTTSTTSSPSSPAPSTSWPRRSPTTGSSPRSPA